VGVAHLASLAPGESTADFKGKQEDKYRRGKQEDKYRSSKRLNAE
jgi:hypothetical protein